jgi:hypothetical protein
MTTLRRYAKFRMTRLNVQNMDFDHCGRLYFRTLLGYYRNASDVDALILLLLLSGLERRGIRDVPTETCEIVRVELIYEGRPNSDPTTHLHGAVFFDARGEAIFHAANACFGISPLKSELTRQLLEFLGVGDELISQLSECCDAGDYHLTLSRETHTAFVYDGRIIPRKINHEWGVYAVR